MCYEASVVEVFKREINNAINLGNWQCRQNLSINFKIIFNYLFPIGNELHLEDTLQVLAPFYQIRVINYSSN